MDQVGRYKSPDEHPFFLVGLPEPLLPPMQYPQVTRKKEDVYFISVANPFHFGSVSDSCCLLDLSLAVYLT